ncbi:MAG: polyribonucleotide nucleotidyltransferase [Phycisphaerae bacterium]|nr:polyribonucleotide nucleotidyltransferase [Phycisphaerae bacterium]
MAIYRVARDIGGRTLTIETGKMAKQSHGAVTVQYGETVVLATVLSAPSSRDLDFFPLYVDYRENTYAAGKIPGGFFKREGRPTTKEILTMRLIDRPIRPLFPEDFFNEVQVQCMALSYDKENDPDLLALIGSSAALAISHAPFDGPVGAARVGFVDGKHVINPTHSQLAESDMDLLVAGPAEAVNMLEMGGSEVSEAVAAEGIRLGFDVCRQIIDMINELAAKVGPVKEYEPTPFPDDLIGKVTSTFGARMKQAKQIAAKAERGDAMSAIRDEAIAVFCPEGEEEPKYTPAQVKEAFYKTEGNVQRELILGGTRPDGRSADQVRPLGFELGVLPRTHGSAVFSRGETQTLAVTTLGTPRDQQIIDGLNEEVHKTFMLHYNFPPFSVGEIRPIRGPGRREIGHGALAEKSLEAVMPTTEQFPYTVRVVSDIMESNGSTSMASVVGGTLALMDAGVPIAAPVAGISIGMVSDAKNEKYVLLTDIVGEEDFHGDMDFKVAGTARGITGIQLDMKARGIAQDRIVQTFAKAKAARELILAELAKVITAPRSQISPFAPRMITIKINPEKIGKVIGPGGKMINKIQDETKATIDIEEDGTIFIASTEGDGAERARMAIEALTEEVSVGRVYTGKVVSIREFGAFVEILPGQDGLCHVSELDVAYIKNVTDVVQVGDEVKVKVIAIDDQGRVKLSRKAVMKDEGVSEGQGDESSGQPSPENDSGSRGGGRSRGGRPRRGGSGGRRDEE